MVHTAAFAPGTLERTPLIYLLASLLDRHLTGTLVLETEAGAKSAIAFVRGAPSKVKTAEPVARLGSVLAESGHLDERALEQSYTLARQRGLLHGEYLRQIGSIDANSLERALRSQLLHKLRWIGQLPPHTGYGFYEEQDFLARWAGDGTCVSPLLVIWDLVRAARELPNLSERISRYEVHEITLDPRGNSAAFGFDAAERALLDVLYSRPHKLAELRRLNVVPEPILERLVYVLSITRHIEGQPTTDPPMPLGVGMGFEEYVGLLASQSSQADVVSAPAPAKSTKPADPPPSPAPAPVMAPADPRGNEEALERRRQLVALAERYEDLDYYELLGVAHDAPVAQIQAAFFEAAKRFHPDKLGAELADLRPISAKLFARITEARQTLTNPELRSRYEAKLSQGVADGQDEQHRIQQIVNASTCFQKAEVLLKKRMLAAAEEEARRAYENDPEQADYLALLAWIQANKSDSVPLLPEILAQLNVAVRMNPDSEKARFYRAQVLTRLGRNLEAVIDYKFVVAKNPRNIDAQREIRLWEMRQQTPAAASAQQRANSLPAKGGVLSKLFKR